MEINTNLQSIMAHGMNESMNVINSQFGNKNCECKNGVNFDNIGAYNLSTGVMGSFFDFDSFADKLINFSNILGTAQNTLAQMQEQGKCICDLINKAHQEECSDEELKAINSEVASRIGEIDKLYHGADFNGINPFESQFGLMIPNWQNMVGGAEEAQAAEKEITELLSSIDFNFDMSVNIDGKEFNMSAAATINIGYTEDGALQITVDASMDYDLSGIVESGAESENALDIITRFLSLLSGKQNDMDCASNFINKIFEKASTSLDNFKYLFPEVSGADSSTSLQGQITQHAAITLDGANQMPNIAINIL